MCDLWYPGSKGQGLEEAIFKLIFYEDYYCLVSYKKTDVATMVPYFCALALAFIWAAG